MISHIDVNELHSDLIHHIVLRDVLNKESIKLSLFTLGEDYNDLTKVGIQDLDEALVYTSSIYIYDLLRRLEREELITLNYKDPKFIIRKAEKDIEEILKKQL